MVLVVMPPFATPEERRRHAQWPAGHKPSTRPIIKSLTLACRKGSSKLRHKLLICGPARSH